MHPRYLIAAALAGLLFCAARDSTSLRGAILRLDVSRLPEGPGALVARALITPATNPLSTPSANARLVWAYGMRNPWRHRIDPVTGAIYAADVGLVSYDELNEVLPGDFLGWPYREGPDVHNVPGCPERNGPGANNYKGPLVAIAHGPVTQAVNTAGMHRPVSGATDNWPQNYAGYYGDVLLKRLSGLWGTPPPAPGQPNAQDWATGLVAALEFGVGPDGSLWWLSQYDSTWEGSTGTLQRIRWTGVTLAVGGEGTAPGAALGAALGAAPNPFRGATRLALRLSARESVTLSLYDVAGRRVRRLSRSEAAGETDLEWDGRDDLGRPVAPGLYVARLESAHDGPRTAALLRLR